MGMADDTDNRMALKQQQFNTAMERYATRRHYKAFSWLVSAVNITLQAYLLWCLRPLSIGIAGQAVALGAAYLLTDFINGLVHMYMDNNDRYTSWAGPLIANFHLHHRTPRYTRRNLLMVYALESGSKVWLVGYLAMTALLVTGAGLPPLVQYPLVYVGVLSSVAEVSHYLCHTSTAPVVLALGNCGILLSKRRHAGHHLSDNVNYAFLNGVTDPLLNLIARCWYPGYKQTTDRHFARYVCDDTGER